MNSPDFNPIDKVFAEEVEGQDWDLGRLYQDLGKIKRDSLSVGAEVSATEKAYLRGLLLGLNPEKMARSLTSNPRTISKTLSDNLYRWIDTLLKQNGIVWEGKKQAEQVASLLVKAKYKVQVQPLQVQPPKIWKNFPTVSALYGRKKELAELERSLTQKQCRMILIHGQSGIGKQSLGATLAERLREKFEGGVWRSLEFLPTLSDLVSELLAELDRESHASSVLSLDQKIARLLKLLEQHRYLLVFKNVESLLQESTHLREYKLGYENYGLFFRQLATLSHQSCVLLLSQEKPPEFKILESSKGTVRSLFLTGLQREAAEKILTDYRLLTPNWWNKLINAYNGNPSELKIVAVHIKDVFEGDVASFFSRGTFFLGDIQRLLTDRWRRLSVLEQEILKLLASSETLIESQLQKMVLSTKSRSVIYEAIESLLEREWLQRYEVDGERRYTLQQKIRRYISLRYL